MSKNKIDTVVHLAGNAHAMLRNTRRDLASKVPPIPLMSLLPLRGARCTVGLHAWLSVGALASVGRSRTSGGARAAWFAGVRVAGQRRHVVVQVGRGGTKRRLAEEARRGRALGLFIAMEPVDP